MPPDLTGRGEVGHSLWLPAWVPLVAPVAPEGVLGDEGAQSFCFTFKLPASQFPESTKLVQNTAWLVRMRKEAGCHSLRLNPNTEGGREATRAWAGKEKDRQR